ncbi:MAG: hypothetical protein FJ146_15695 [Deltaproteobacteria bacterium]|nr:hypothetical protein [Deltaproteobacteria bacterium]
MKNKVLLILIGVATIYITEVALAKNVYFGSAPETVPVAYGAATIVRFEEPVKTVSNAADFMIRPVSPDTPDYAVLSVEPRQKLAKADVVFILASGDMATLRLKSVPAEAKLKVESVYDIKSQKALVENRAAATPYIGRLELITAMIRGDQVTGYEVKKESHEIASGIPETKVTLLKTYTGGDFKGFVYEVENLASDRSLEIDVRGARFGEPNQAVLGYTERSILEGAKSSSNKTLLVMVTKPTASSSEALLPIRITKPGNQNSKG